jgi:hypothetical protein
VAKSKLVGGRKETMLNPKDADQVFAVISFRLCLDVCLENPIALPLVRRAVNSHLRVVASMDQPMSILHTFTPSEPVLARAAMELLCDTNNWTTSIETFARSLLQRGVIEKGLKGELYSRLVLILAHDQLRWNPLTANGGSSFMPTFTVEEFLVSLYVSEYHELIRRIPLEILKARMNFTHFTSTSDNLSLDVVPELCHDLLRRSAALQLSFTQPTYDKLIPIYFGDVNEPFDDSQCGVILIQDKNNAVATTIRSVFGEDFTKIDQKVGQPLKRLKFQKSPAGGRPYSEKDRFIFHSAKNPILFLIFDMGVSPVVSQPFELSYSNYANPQIWAIHSRGHSKDIFGCLESMDHLGGCELFFSSITERSGKYADIAKANMAFRKPARAFRYPAAGEGDDEGEEDIQMRDA